MMNLLMFKKPEKHGPLSKEINLVDGAPDGNAKHCWVAEGLAKEVTIDNLGELVDIIDQCDPQIALAIGRLNDAGQGIAMNGRAEVISERKLIKDHKGVLPLNTITRSLDYIHFAKGAPALMLLDADFKGAPPAVVERVKAAGGVWNVLQEVIPALRNVPHASRASTSAGLYNVETGEQYPASMGEHIYVPVSDGADIKRVLKRIAQRCWLDGLGWIVISKSGQLLTRTIVDIAVASPERLIFEGAPKLGAGLAQDEEARRLRVHEGELDQLDTADVRNLTIVERSRFNAALAAAKEEKAPEARVIRAKDDERVAADIIKRSGGKVSPETAKAQAQLRHQGVLGADIVIHFDDPEIGDATVGEILADPEKFAGCTAADPLEPTYGGVGNGFGRCKAKVFYRRATGEVVINSFAHGGAVYKLAQSERTIRAAIDAATPADALETALSMLVSAPAMPAGVDEAILAYALSKAKIATISAARGMLAARRKEKAEKEREETRERRARRDQRIPMVIPAKEKDPLEPTCRNVDEVLAAAADHDLTPPVRDLAGRLATIRMRPPPGLHWLGRQGPNGEPVPPPPQASISACANESETELVAEKYLAMSAFMKDGLEPRALPSAHLRALSRYSATQIGVCHTVSTIPLVTPDGTVLNRNGFDAKRGIFFNIPAPLLHVIPTGGRCSIETAAKSYQWLVDVWLVDVKTTPVGKAILISLALTLIARCFIDIKPGFAVTAGMQEAGKTTSLHMISIAVLGVEAAAAAWASDETERQKALTGYLLAATPMVVFDNIEQGSTINSPTYDAVFTSGRFANRLLGGNAMLDAAVDTIFAWTGNSIGFSRDLVTRLKVVGIEADRADPSNRDFAHEDPLSWTRDNRPEILEHLFNVLTAEIDVVDKATGRFKTWYRMIGARIEAVAEGVSFDEIAKAQNKSGDAALGVGMLWGALESHFGSGPFRSHNIKPLISGLSSEADELREMFENVFPDKDFSGKRTDLTRAIGWALKSRVGAVGKTHDDRLLRLDKVEDKGHVAAYCVADPSAAKKTQQAGAGAAGSKSQEHGGDDAREQIKLNAVISNLDEAQSSDDFARAEIKTWLRAKGLKSAAALTMDHLDEARELLARVRGPARYFNDAEETDNVF